MVRRSKKKPTPSISVASLTDDLGKIQALIIPLKKKLEALKPQAKRLEEQLIALLNLKADQAAPVDGRQFAGTVSACGFEREIVDKPFLIQCLGEERYMDESKILLGRLDDLLKDGTLTAEQFAKIVSREQTGGRDVVILKKQRKAV